MSTPTVSWDETSPAGTQAISLGDDRIRELKTQLREIITVDHEMASSGQDTDWGYHNKVTLQELAADPSAVANTVILYTKETSSKAELYWIDEDSNVVQITSAGKLVGTFVGDIVIPATSKVRIDGDASGNTYDFESSADIKDTYVGGVNYIKIDHGNTKISLLNADVVIAATKKLYLDGGSNTYIYEASADVIAFYQNGARQFNFAATALHVDTGNIEIEATYKLFLDGGTHSYIYEATSDIVRLYAGGQDMMAWDGGTPLVTCITNFAVQATGKIYFDGGGDSYMYEAASNDVRIYSGGTEAVRIVTGTVVIADNVNPDAGGTGGLGTSDDYWAVLHVHTVTKQGGGGFGYFDEGVELQDGRIVSDVEALINLKPHPSKKTQYGKPAMDITSIPKPVFTPANINGIPMERENNIPYVIEDGKKVYKENCDGEDVFAMMSIMIGAIREIGHRLNKLEAA